MSLRMPSNARLYWSLGLLACIGIGIGIGISIGIGIGICIGIGIKH